MTEARTLTRRDRVLLWGGFAGPFVAWTIHLIAGYGYEEAACSTGTGTDLIEPVIIALTAVLFPVAVAGGLAALATSRAASRGELADPRGRIGFMGVSGILGAVLFGAAILLQGLQIIGLAPCAS